MTFGCCGCGGRRKAETEADVDVVAVRALCNNVLHKAKCICSWRKGQDAWVYVCVCSAIIRHCCILEFYYQLKYALMASKLFASTKINRRNNQPGYTQRG